jgi:hypothetical protein
LRGVRKPGLGTLQSHRIWDSLEAVQIDACSLEDPRLLGAPLSLAHARAFSLVVNVHEPVQRHGDATPGGRLDRADTDFRETSGLRSSTKFARTLA